MRRGHCLLALGVFTAIISLGGRAGGDPSNIRKPYPGSNANGESGLNRERGQEDISAPHPPQQTNTQTTKTSTNLAAPSWTPLPEHQEEVEEGTCLAEDEECGGNGCEWGVESGAIYSLSVFSDHIFQTSIVSLKGSLLRFSVCASSVSCNGRRSPTCLSVPGVKLTSTGVTVSAVQIEPHLPGRGFKLVLVDGDLCELTGKPRSTAIHLPCKPDSHHRMEGFKPTKATEGTKENVCRYTVEFPPSQFGCPVEGGRDELPLLSAVQGCVDSFPLLTTEDCHYAAETQLSLHGLNFHLLCPEASHGLPRFSSSRCTTVARQLYTVHIGPILCRDIIILSQYTMNCTVDRGEGVKLDVVVTREDSGGEREVVMELGEAVSFKEVIDFREKFAKFTELGVGGLRKEIDELYRRAFASRGVSQNTLERMGITHVKGILLYGPPGTGKTLIARTIAKILGSKQVEMINGPEIISKYLGESERNLRGHFGAAQKAWKEHGLMSELFVIIIDEIDAICKPRGKTDQSAAGVAYDALVNQLLTLMDGLSEAYNTLVVGLTNRRELLDPALLRPGRFEVQIEINLPDEEGREEIFEIHTRAMSTARMLAQDVNLGTLATMTPRFSGAEIAGVVRAASSFALERFQLADRSGEDILVTMADFEDGVLSINPAYTQSETQVSSRYLPHGYLSCGEPHATVLKSSLSVLHMVQQSSTGQLQTLLLYGPRGSGKTALAAQLAIIGEFSFVKIITASSVVGRSSLHKTEVLHTAFSDSFSSQQQLSLVVLDDLHRLVEFVKIGHQLTVSHELLHTLTTLLTSPPPPGVKVLVVGTLAVEEEESLDDEKFLGLPDLFLHQSLVPLLDCDSVLSFLNASNIYRFRGGSFSLPTKITLSIRQLQQSIQCACTQGSCSSDHKEPSVVHQDHLLDCIMASLTRKMAVLDTQL